MLTIIIMICSLLSNFLYADNTKEERSVEVFTKVDLRIAADLILTQGEQQKVLIEANEEILEDLVTIVKNGTLIIKYEVWKITSKRPQIYITMKDIQGVDVSGSGSVSAETKIIGTDIEFNISGSGKMNFTDFAADNIEINISGSGRLELFGSDELESMDFDISGSGDIISSDLIIKNISGDISGSGTAKVNAITSLEGIPTTK